MMDASQAIFRNIAHNSAPARGTADQQHLVMGCRKRPQSSFRDKYGLTGAVISAVDLHKGLAICRVGADQRAWRHGLATPITLVRSSTRSRPCRTRISSFCMSRPQTRRVIKGM
jgi:hypothetical protein